MDNIKIGDRLQIHCYKHDKQIYRSWDEALVLDITDEYTVVGNDKTTVTECDGRTWRTKEPAIIYFYNKKWYNIISQLKETGIYYYCNIATPYIIEDNTIKYIDYDLDLRIFPDSTYKILDKSEYEYHKKKMNYSDDIDKIVNNELRNLINLYDTKNGPFNPTMIEHYAAIYKNMKQKVDKY